MSPKVTGQTGGGAASATASYEMLRLLIAQGCSVPPSDSSRLPCDFDKVSETVETQEGDGVWSWAAG